MLAERLGECLIEAHLRHLVSQNERQALGEDAVKYPLLTQEPIFGSGFAFWSLV